MIVQVSQAAYTAEQKLQALNTQLFLAELHSALDYENLGHEVDERYYEQLISTYSHMSCVIENWYLPSILRMQAN